MLPRVGATMAAFVGSLHAANGQEPPPDYGAVGCRCSTSGDWRLSYTDNSTGEPLLTVARDGSEYSYPYAYGSGECEQWDVFLEPSCADSDGNPLPDAPTWCTRRWCFVDRGSCDQIDVERSIYFPDVEVYCASRVQLPPLPLPNSILPPLAAPLTSQKCLCVRRLVSNMWQCQHVRSVA